MQLARVAVIFAALYCLVGCGSGNGGIFAQFVVTANGGTVKAGRATLVFPQGAVTQDTTVTIELTDQFPPDNRIVGETTYRFNAGGVTFAQPVEINIEYDVARMPTGGQESSLALCQAVDNSWKGVPGSSVNTTTDVAQASVTQFNNGAYGVLALNIGAN